MKKMEGFLIQLGYTAGQAAVRAPLYAGLLIAETAILVGGLLYELDRLGVFDGLGAWIGSTLHTLLTYTTERK